MPVLVIHRLNAGSNTTSPIVPWPEFTPLKVVRTIFLSLCHDRTRRLFSASTAFINRLRYQCTILLGQQKRLLSGMRLAEGKHVIMTPEVFTDNSIINKR